VKNRIRSENLTQCEAQLVRLAQQGHTDAFATLFDLHKAGVYSLCLRAACDKVEAEDLTESIFLQVFRSLSDFHEGTELSVWIYRMAVKRLLVHQRKTWFCASSLDHLVRLAGDPVCPCGAATRFARMRAQVRNARFNISVPRPWMSVLTRFGRSRGTAKATS
jgi:hypothetical protein